MNVKEMAMDIAKNCYVPDNPSSDDVREVVDKAAFDMAKRILSKVQVVNIRRAVGKNTFNFSIPYVQENFEKWMNEELAIGLCREIVDGGLADVRVDDGSDELLFDMRLYIINLAKDNYDTTRGISD